MAEEDGLPQSPRRPKNLEWIIGHGTAILALLGLLTYGLLRLNYSIFYDRLGVTPEDVGLGYATTLSQSAVGLILLLSVVFLSLIVGLTIFSAAFRDTPDKLVELFSSLFRTTDKSASVSQQNGAPAIEYSIPYRGVGFAVRLFLTLLLLTVFYIAIRGGLLTVEGELNPYGLAALVALVLLSTRQLLEFGRTVAQREVLIALWQRYRRLLLYILVTAVLLMLVWLPRQAIQDADRVREGHASRTSLFGIPLLSSGGDTAVLTWLEGTPPSTLEFGKNRCLIYLGEANNTAIFYDVLKRHPLRLPSSKIGISLNSNESACPKGRPQQTSG